MEAGQYGLTRGACFLACHLELEAVPGLLWISWCVSGGADFLGFFFDFFFFFERTRPAASTRPPLVSFTSLLVFSHDVDCSCYLPVELKIVFHPERRLFIFFR